MSSSNRLAVRVAAAALAAVLPHLALAQSDSRFTDLTAMAAAEVRAFLDGNGSPRPLCSTEDGRAVWAAVQAFYSARGDRPVWLDGDRLTPAGARLVAVLGAAREEGLPPRHYDPAELAGPRPGILRASVAAEPLVRQAARWEVGMTAALARLVSDVGRGRIDPERGGGVWRGGRGELDLVSVLHEAARSGRPDQVLEASRPAHPQYAALRGALARFLLLAAREPEVPALPDDLRLRPGARSPHLVALRARLLFWGDLAPGASAGGSFDPALVEALKRFQARHGLRADGVAGKETVAALNTPVSERVRQIQLNLERWRWQERTGGRRSILVNVPTFTLHAYEADGGEAFRMGVITGKPDTPTPVFDQEMTTVVFSPYWTVPPGIVGETLSAVRRDRSYLRRMNMQVVRGGAVVDPATVSWGSATAGISFRQRPGARNALGQVKFLIANPFNVYLHDTPAKALFRRATRTFSHGCVRLEKAETLARWVLADQPDWTARAIAAAMRSGRERGVALAEPIPVSIAYFTAWVDPDGAVQFRPDVYRHDAAHGRLLEALEPPPAGTVAVAATAG